MINFNEQSVHKAFLLYFFAVLFISQIAYPMNFIQAWRNKKTADAFVSNFPSMTFNEARVAWNNVSDDHQKQIELADKKRNKGKENLIFNIVRYLPCEIKKNIMVLFFNNDTTAADAADIFLKMPMHDAFEQYAYSREMVKNSSYWHPGLDLRTIPLADAFVMTEHLQIAARIFQNKQKILGRRDIEALQAIASKSSLKMDLFKNNAFLYSFYKAYTFEMFLDGAVPGAVIAGSISSLVGLIWLSRLITLYGCEKTVTLDNVVQMNALIQKSRALILESGQEELLTALRPLADTMAYSWASYCKINAPFLLGIPMLGAICFLDNTYLSISDRFKKSIFFGLILGVPLAVVLFILSFVPFEKFPGSFLGVIGGIFAICFSFVTALTLGNAHCWRTSDVNWDKISDELQCTDIVMQR